MIVYDVIYWIESRGYGLNDKSFKSRDDTYTGYLSFNMLTMMTSLMLPIILIISTFLPIVQAYCYIDGYVL